ncbi:MAG: DUF937 domain-containing protein [Paludibacteraceae bacterium]
MDLSSLLNGAIGQTVIANVAGQLGMNESQAANAINAAIPAILGGINKNVQSTDGATSLDKALQKHDGSLLDNLTGIFSNNSQELQQDGSGILGHVFGNKQKDMAQAVSEKAGISMQQVGPLLSMLAPIVMGYLGKQKKDNNTNADGLGGLIGGLLGGEGSSSAGGGIMDMVTGLLDKDKDGSALDDIMGMFTK